MGASFLFLLHNRFKGIGNLELFISSSNIVSIVSRLPAVCLAAASSSRPAGASKSKLLSILGAAERPLTSAEIWQAAEVWFDLQHVRLRVLCIVEWMVGGP
jgi:hypothetical protein